MATALDLIREALSDIQVLNPDTALTAQEEADGLTMLNELLEMWALAPINAYNESLHAVACTGVNPETVGTGGTFNFSRPIRIDKITAEISPGFDKPMRQLDWSDYADIRLKALIVNYPQYWYASYEYPFTKLYIWPVPAAGMQLKLWTIDPIASFATTATTVSLPPGYRMAIRRNLAVHAAPAYQTNVDDNLANLARVSLRAIQRQNTRVPTLQVDPSLYDTSKNKFGYNIFTDNY